MSTPPAERIGRKVYPIVPNLELAMLKGFRNRPTGLRLRLISEYNARFRYDPNVSETSPVVNGTWVTVDAIWEMHSGGKSVKEILNRFPELEEADVTAALLI